MAGVAALREGRGGVDGVPAAAQHVGGVQELGVGHRLQRGGGAGGVRTARRQLRNPAGHVSTASGVLEGVGGRAEPAKECGS